MDVHGKLLCLRFLLQQDVVLIHRVECRRFAQRFDLIAASAAAMQFVPIAPSLRFLVPLAIAPREYGLPGVCTPSIVRPWVFSTLRRFSPPRGFLSFSARYHLWDFKERASVQVCLFDSRPAEGSLGRPLETNHTKRHCTKSDPVLGFLGTYSRT
jgi:hypothetical protein